MARVGKITVYVDRTTHGQSLSIRTTGALGTVPLNTVSLDQGYAYQSSAPDAKTFWESILTLAQAMVVAS